MDKDATPAWPPGEPDRSLRISVVEGNIESCSIAITNGALLTGFALMLGANAFHLGLMSGGDGDIPCKHLLKKCLQGYSHTFSPTLTQHCISLPFPAAQP